MLTHFEIIFSAWVINLNVSSVVLYGLISIWIFKTKCSYYYTLILFNLFSCLFFFITTFQLLYPLVFFLSEFSRQSVPTIIHWFFSTCFLVFLSLSQHFNCSLVWPSFYLNFQDKVFLLLYIDSFQPVSLSFFLYHNVSAALSSGFLYIWISKTKCSYYYVLILLDRFLLLYLLEYNGPGISFYISCLWV